MTVFRLPPQLAAEQMKTYAVVRQRNVHDRPAACAEVECSGFRNGWRTIVPAGSVQDQYIRARSGRSFTTQPQPGSLVAFTFAPGQNCFSEHRLPVERMPLFVVKGGDWRGNPRQVRPIAKTAEAWVEDFAGHQQNIHDLREKG